MRREFSFPCARVSIINWRKKKKKYGKINLPPFPVILSGGRGGKKEKRKKEKKEKVSVPNLDERGKRKKEKRKKELEKGWKFKSLVPS